MRSIQIKVGDHKGQNGQCQHQQEQVPRLGIIAVLQGNEGDDAVYECAKKGRESVLRHVIGDDPR